MNNETYIALMILWSLPWKGFALWKAARLGHKVWFIAILVINTMGLLEILYIFFLSKQNINLDFITKRFKKSK